MASPQIDNGKFTRISNEILERLCQCNLTGKEARICFYVLRVTYGYQRKEAEISSADLADQLDSDASDVRKILGCLCDRGILKKTASHRGVKPPVYGVNKDWETWDFGRKKPLPTLIASRGLYAPTSVPLSGVKHPDKQGLNPPTNGVCIPRLTGSKPPDYAAEVANDCESVDTRRKKKEERRNNPLTPKGNGGGQNSSLELRERVREAMTKNGWSPSRRELTRAVDLVETPTPTGWDKSAWRKHVFRRLMELCQQVKEELLAGKDIYAPIAAACERLRNRIPIDAMLPPKAS